MNLPDDLTNLNWVSGAPVPIPSVSPPGSARSRQSFLGLKNAFTTTPKTNRMCGSPISLNRKFPNSTPRRVRRSDSNSRVSQSGGTTRPKCSYTCLIGMAMQASPYVYGCLPVQEIYKYIEREFPYFKTAPDGWKNSVRHNLSLNPAFRKVHRSDGWQGKKGHFWEMTPEKKKIVDEEVRQFLESEGRPLTTVTDPSQERENNICGEDVMITKREKKTNHLKGKKKTAKRKLKFSKSAKKTPPSPPKPNSPNMVKEYSKDMQEQLLNSEVSVVPTLSPTRTALDTSHVPSTYIGIDPPSQDPGDVATELFGINENSKDLSPTNISPTNISPTNISPTNITSASSYYNPSMVPFITPLPTYYGQYGLYPPAVFYPDSNNAISSIVSPTTTTTAALTPIGSPFISPHYVQCVPFSPYMGIMPPGAQPMYLPPPQEAMLHTPVSVEVLDSSQDMEIGDVIELIEDNFCTENNPELNECDLSNSVVENLSTHSITNSPKCRSLTVGQAYSRMSVQNQLSLSELGSIEESTQKETLISLKDLKLMFGEDYSKLTEEEAISTLKFLNWQARQQHSDTNLADHHSRQLLDDGKKSREQEAVETERIENEFKTVESYLNCRQDSECPNSCHLYSVQADIGSPISESRMEYSGEEFITSVPRLESLLNLNDQNIECIEEALRMGIEQEVVVSSSSTAIVTVDVES